MSEPATAVPKSEDKPTEVTPAVEPSPETAVESSAPAPDARKDVKVEEPAKTDTPAATTTAAEPSSASNPKEPKKGDEPAESSKVGRAKGASFLNRLLEGIRHPRRDREKKKAPVPAAEEPAAPAEEPSPADAKPEVKPEGAPADPVKEVEATPAPAESVPQEQVKNEDPPKEEKVERAGPARAVAKVTRRLSQHVSNLWKPGHNQVDPPAKVAEKPPTIKEPTPVAPLENPAADSTPVTGEQPQKEETKETKEPPKIIDSTPTPVVATA